MQYRCNSGAGPLHPEEDTGVMRRSHSVAIGTIAASLLVLDAAAAFACPELGGTYDCPAAANQLPMTLIVKMVKTTEEGAQYTMTYRIMGKDLVTGYDVPPKSLRKSTDADSCTNTALVHKEVGDEAVQMSLNAAGNFERAKGGKIEIVCNAKKGSGG